MSSQQCVITPKGAVHLFGKIVQGIRLNYIPEKLQEGDCASCHKLLLVKVVKSSVVPGVKVSMLPRSRFQFFIEFDFNGLFAVPVFQISVQLNPDMKSYFDEEDMAQLSVITIDPATLARSDRVE